MNEDDLVDSVEEPSTPEAEEVSDDQPEADVESSESEDDDIEEDDEVEQDEEQPEDEGSDPDTVTVEYDGEEYTVPKRIQDGLMATKDYTEKTQTLAEDRRNYDAERHDFTQYMEASKAHSGLMADLSAIDQQLVSYQNYDWNAAFDADITSATKLRHQMDQLQGRREQVVGSIQQAETERTNLQHENMVRTAQRTDAALAKRIPGWGDERKAELGRFAVEQLGFPAKSVSNAVTEAEIETLHYAEIGYRTVQQVKAKEKAAGKPKADVKPSANLKPKRQSAPKTLSKVSDPAQYREMRLAQKRKKAS